MQMTQMFLKEMAEEAQVFGTDEETTSKKLFNQFCGPDFKNEIALVRIIKEITDTNNKLSRRVETYNEENKHKKSFHLMQSVHPLEFETQPRRRVQ